VQDSSLGGSSDDEDLLGVIRGPSTFANAFLYIGNEVEKLMKFQKVFKICF
jgi:hypothetical protein